MSTRPVLVTGAAGFIGRHLVAALVAEGRPVLALSRDGRRMTGATAVASSLDPDDRALVRALRRHRPSVVCHLAGPTRNHFDAIGEAIESTQALVRACAEVTPRPKLVIVSSSAVYGPSVDHRPLDESCSPSPLSEYGTAKLAGEAVAMRAADRGAVPLVRVRLFNVIGPGQSGMRVPGAFAAQIAAIEAGRAEPVLHVRSLDAVRDYVDVRDAVQALALLMRRGRAGALYHVCRGRAATPRQLLDAMLRRSRATGIAVRVTPDRELSWQVGRARPLRALGWRPRIPLATSAADILEDFRQRGART